MDALTIGLSLSIGTMVYIAYTLITFDIETKKH